MENPSCCVIHYAFPATTSIHQAKVLYQKAHPARRSEMYVLSVSVRSVRLKGTKGSIPTLKLVAERLKGNSFKKRSDLEFWQ